MESTALCDSLIEAVCQFRALIGQLVDMYANLERILNAEERALSQRCLREVEAIKEKKELLGADIVRVAEEIESQIKKFRPTLERLSLSVPRTISEYHKALQMAANHLVEERLANQVLTHQLQRLKPEMEQLSEQSRTMNGLVKRNRYLIEQHINLNQRSFQFWQSIFQEASSIYDNKGEKRASDHESFFRVEA